MITCTSYQRRSDGEGYIGIFTPKINIRIYIYIYITCITYNAYNIIYKNYM